MIENMAVPNVARARSRVEREWIASGGQLRLLRVLRCKPEQDSRDLAGRRNERVFPSTLARRRRFRRPRQKVMHSIGRWVENRILYVCPYCWMIERKRRTVKALPVSLEAVD